MPYPEPPAFKTCSTCRRRRARIHFAKDASNPDGLQRSCLDCAVIAMRRWREARREIAAAKPAMTRRTQRIF
jgi:hypothetical protein